MRAAADGSRRPGLVPGGGSEVGQRRCCVPRGIALAWRLGTTTFHFLSHFFSVASPHVPICKRHVKLHTISADACCRDAGCSTARKGSSSVAGWFVVHRRCEWTSISLVACVSRIVASVNSLEAVDSLDPPKRRSADWARGSCQY